MEWQSTEWQHGDGASLQAALSGTSTIHLLASSTCVGKRKPPRVSRRAAIQTPQYLWSNQHTTSVTQVTHQRDRNQRRRDLLDLLDPLSPTIAELTQAIEHEAEEGSETQRFHCAKQIASYRGLVPLEDSSGNRRLGLITKQGSSILRFLLVGAAQVTVRSIPE